MGSRKARTLLALLAADPTVPHDADWLAERLWSGDAPQEPADNVATLVSRLRGALGAGAILGDRTGWRLGDVSVDVREAHALVRAAGSCLATEPALALSSATSALGLLDGEALVGEPAADWIDALRAEVHRLAGEARHAGAVAALAVDDPQLAVRLAEESCAADPFDEVAVRLLMRASSAAGEPARGLAAYERLRHVLAEELGTDPAPETRQVFQDVLAERPPEAEPPALDRVRVPVPAPTSQAASARLAGLPSQVIAGREEELARLRERWGRAVAGEPGLLLLCGEAGIGKTRLAGELVAMVRATGGSVLQARCYETESSLLLQPLVDALRPAILRSSPAALREIAGDRAATLALLVPEVADVLGPMPREVATPETERRLAFEAVASVVRRLASRAPVLLLLDDLQVAGLSTLDGVHLLVRRAGSAPLLVVATLRTEEGHEAVSRLGELAERLDVGPLSPAAVEALAASAGQRQLAGSIMARTGGHSLFVVETLRALREGQEGIPSTLSDAVTRRVARAGPEVEELARAAAVLGASFEPETVAGLLELGEPVAARRCEALVAARLTVASGRTYEFVNDLVHEVLYATTPEPTRHTYHRRAAELLADQPERAAPHAAAAGQWARAATYWLDAADQASRRFVLPDAERLLDQGIAAAVEAGDPQLQLRGYLDRGRVRETVGSYPQAMADFRVALELAEREGLEHGQMHAHRELAGDAAVGMGLGLDAGATHLQAALELAARLGETTVEAGLLARSAVLASNRLRFAEALDLGRRAVAAGRASGDTRALALGLDGLKTVYAYTGRIAELTALTDELEVLLRRAGNLHLLQWTVFERAMVPLARGGWDQARSLVEEALAISRRSGRIGHESWYLAHLGWIARLRGDLDDAVAQGRRSLDVPSTTHTWFQSTACAMQAANVLARSGDAARDEALLLLRRGLAAAESGSAESYRLRCLAPLAELTGDVEPLAAADDMLRSATFAPGCAWVHGLEAYLALARAWRAAGDDGRAREVLTSVVGPAEDAGWRALMEASGVYALVAELAPRPQNRSASRAAARRAPSEGTSR
ncbi:MAG TPA: BTAD domain-containing putative transcriptional regulator [Actinomycetes bacterium]|nr:BTAD domain-containing putative transcriptional regulator [Actinomycetes bacterium]